MIYSGFDMPCLRNIEKWIKIKINVIIGRTKVRRMYRRVKVDWPTL